MKIKARAPQSATELELDAQPTEQLGEEGWEITFPDHKTVFIYEKNGRWQYQSQEQQSFDEGYIQQLGHAIKPEGDKMANDQEYKGDISYEDNVG